MSFRFVACRGVSCQYRVSAKFERLCALFCKAVDGFDDAVKIVVRHPASRGEAESLLEKIFGNTVSVEGGRSVNRLQVHGFPEQSRFDVRFR